MRLRLLLLALASTAAPVAAHAQVGLYLNPIALRISNSTKDTGTFAFLGSNVDSRMFYGVNFGGYYTVLPSPKYDVSLDLRDSIIHGNNAFLNSFLVGARIDYKPERGPFRPYAQASVGVGTSRAPATAVHVSKLQYGIYGGLDATIQRHVDFRIIEVGYGSVTTVSSQTVGGVRSIPAASVLSISSGLVFRIP